MNNPQLPDNEIIERARRQIVGLMSEIAGLTRAGLPPREYYTQMLTRLVAALASAGGAVWTFDPDGRLAPAFQINLAETGLDQDGDARRHEMWLQRVAASGQSVLVPPRSSVADDGAANPTDFMLVLAPFRDHERTCGVIELLQRPGGAPSAQQGYLRLVEQAAELTHEFHRSLALRELMERQTLWSRLETFSRAVHASLHPRETAFTIVNEARRLIECDRVSLAICHGQKCRVEAMSGQDRFDRRSNTVVLLGRLATAVVKAGEPLRYAGDARNLPPQIERAVQAYVDESQSKRIDIFPLRRGEADSPRAAPDILAALIVEQIDSLHLPQGYERRVEVVRDHAGLAIGNALQHERLFLLPLWRLLGRLGFVVKARTLPKTLLVLAGLAAIIAALCLVPADFALEGRGELQPVVRQDIFAGDNGVVHKLHVKHGDEVAPGQPLVELRNTELEMKEVALRGERAAALEELLAVEASLLNSRDLAETQREQALGRKRQLEQTLRSLDNQLALQQRIRQRLVCTSAIAGSVITLDLHNRLAQRPVQRGQLLLTVADTKGQWELLVRMPEDRMGHILRAWNARGAEPSLPVTFILANDPGSQYQGELLEIEQRAEVRGEEGNTVLLRVKIDKHRLPQLRSGASVVARVHCGQRAIGYVWLHDLFEFVQAKVLFRL